MTVSRKRFTSLLLLGILALVVVPGMAQAAPADPVVTVFGNARPVDPDCGDATLGCGVIYANSQPFAPDGPHGAVYYKGQADPGVVIDVAVTDGLQTLTYRTTTAPLGSTLADDGYLPGEFGWHVPCGFSKCEDMNAIVVTRLGTHKAVEVNAPGGPTSTDPANWGPSILDVNFTARAKGVDGKFFTADDELSNTVTENITKYAGSPLDDVAPVFRFAKFPPEHWCHTSSRGMQYPGALDPFGFGARGQSLQGDSTGKCSRLAQAGVGALPDPTWVPCSDPHRVLIDKSLPSFYNAFGGGNNAYCREDGRGPGSGHSIPTGEAPLSGEALDDSNNADGLSSEIAEVKVEFLKGTAQYRPAIILTDAMINGQEVASRYGSRAGWALPLKIQDFEPNWPAGPAYKITVTVTDAWGNSVSASSPNITVYPW